jgi:tetratricopeptide (TPR) repeat protein
VNLSDKVKPIQAKQPDKKELVPSLNADAMLSIEGLLGNIRGEQEAILGQIIENTPDSDVDEKADAYFRLGELYAKQQRFWRLKSTDSLIKADTANNAAEKSNFQKEQVAAADKAKTFMLKAVKTYNALTKNDAFRNYPKMDMALFYYGYTLQGGKYLKEARRIYDQLLKNYPQSKFVPEAHLAFADYHFEQGQLDEAEARYKMVLKFPKMSAFWYATYKMGWIHLNKQRFFGALDTFSEVAKATKNEKKQETLHRAAKKDFVRAYSEIGKVSLAYVSFQRIDDKGAGDMLEVLADLYIVQGKSDKAIYAYHELMKLQPKSKNVCLWQYNIAHATMSLAGAGNADKVKEIENLNRLYGALKGTKTLPASEMQECHDNAAAMSGELARAYHSEAAKTNDPETLAYAEKLYKVYLEVFTDVVKTGKVDAKLKKEAAYAAVLGWKNALNVDPRAMSQAESEDDPKDNDKIPQPKPIPEREQKMLAAFDVYIDYIKDPKDAELVGMKFLKARTYRNYNQFDKATPIFEDILDHHRGHESAEFSANLLLYTYEVTQQYDKLLALADKLSKDTKFLDGKDKLKEVIATIKATSMRKKAEAMATQAKETKDFSKYIQCGQAYLDIYNADPENKSNDEVLFSAGFCFMEGRSIGAAIQAFTLLQKYYPTSTQSKKALMAIGTAYGDIAFYERSAEKLEEYAKKYAGEQDAYTAMSDAVFYRKGIGDDAKAIDNTNYFIKTFGTKNPKEAANAAFSLTTVYEKQGDKDKVIAHLRNYIRQYGAKGGDDRLVIANAKIGQLLWEQSCPVKQVDGSCVKIVRERAINLKKRKRAKGSDQPTQCGPDSKIKLTVVKRDDRKLKDARAAFAAAAKAFEKTQGKTGGDEAGARFYYGLAKVAEADVDFESYLALQFPANLNFDPQNKSIAEKSLKRFTDWVEQKTKVGENARMKYEGVLAIKDAANSITAAARLGQISQNFSDALFTSEIPKDVRSGELADDKVEAFCDTMTEVAEPLEAHSLKAYGVCLDKSTELGWFSEWSKMCERELGQIKPEDFPTASELRAEPSMVASVISIEPPVQRLD